MTDLQLKGAQVSDTITVPPGPGTLLFRGNDWDNSITIHADGRVEYGEKYDRSVLAAEVGEMLARDYDKVDRFEATVPHPEKMIGFTIDRDGGVVFENWLPETEAVAFVEALAVEFARAVGGQSE